MNQDITIEASTVLEIIQQENPQVYELALRRAIIERQRMIIDSLSMSTNGEVPA